MPESLFGAERRAMHFEHSTQYELVSVYLNSGYLVGGAAGVAVWRGAARAVVAVLRRGGVHHDVAICKGAQNGFIGFL